MSIKIKTPPMPEPDTCCFDEVWSHSADQLAARDAQWMELVGNLTDALWNLLDGSQHVGEMHWTGMDELSPWDKARAALRAISIAAPLLTECGSAASLLAEEQE